jgi:hypothetical protein
VFLIQDAFGGQPKVALTPTRTAQVGTSLFRDYVLPFEVVSVLLLAALIGAVVIARRDETPEEEVARAEEAGRVRRARRGEPVVRSRGRGPA